MLVYFTVVINRLLLFLLVISSHLQMLEMEIRRFSLILSKPYFVLGSPMSSIHAFFLHGGFHSAESDQEIQENHGSRCLLSVQLGQCAGTP